MEDLDPFSLPSSSPPDNSSSSPLAHRSTCEAKGENPPIASPHGQLWGMDSSDPGVIFSSPVRNIADSRRKAQKARRKTLEQKQVSSAQNTETAFHEALNVLKLHGLTFGDLAAFVFDPAHMTRGWHWSNFFCKPEQVTHVLDSLICKDNSPTAWNTVLEWATRATIGLVSAEAHGMTKGGALRITDRNFDATFALGLNFDTLWNTVAEECPVTIKILQSICTTDRQRRDMEEKRAQHKHFVSQEFDVIEKLGTQR